MKIYLVGGAVRDKLLNLPVKERDYVVVGATVNEMLQLGFRQVGKEFPVFLHPKTGEEYALARAERKVKPGYKGFVFDTSKDVALEADLKRRDLTINAMAEDLETDMIIDPFHGQEDIKQKTLRHVSNAFAEDPVRILRVGRFLARYAALDFHVDEETLTLMRDMVAAGEVDALVAERVWKELSRALTEKNPEMFFKVLLDCEALEKLFPLLKITDDFASLIAATQLSADPQVRFAALFYTYKEDPSTAKKNIETLCERYRVPNDYRQLTVLTALHHEQALGATTLSAEELLKLFTVLDIFRRPKRFQQFVMVCEAIAKAKQIKFQANWLLYGAKVASSVDAQEWIKQGFQNTALAEKLKEQRKLKIAAWLEIK